MIEFLLKNLIWTEGLYILLISILICIILYFWRSRLIVLPIIFIFFSFYFFRNPERQVSDEVADNASVIVSPSDGEVIEIENYFDESLAKAFKKVSIFLSPFDVHVNWIPISGKILKVSYTPGKFMFAYLPKSSELNERNEITLVSDCSKLVLVRQVAGLIARRIVCWVKQDDHVKRGQKFGMIKFGSRVDILIEEPVLLDVKIGQKVRGSESIIGKWSC